MVGENTLLIFYSDWIWDDNLIRGKKNQAYRQGSWRKLISGLRRSTSLTRIGQYIFLPFNKVLSNKKHYW